MPLTSPCILPKLKCINWFDHYKPEAEAQSQWIDWRISAHPVIGTRSSLTFAPVEGSPYFLSAQEFDCLQRADCITAQTLPEVIPLTGSVMVTLNTKAQTNCDVVVIYSIRIIAMARRQSRSCRSGHSGGDALSHSRSTGGREPRIVGASFSRQRAAITLGRWRGVTALGRWRERSSPPFKLSVILQRSFRDRTSS
jgi:hypothetical protein